MTYLERQQLQRAADLAASWSPGGGMKALPKAAEVDIVIEPTKPITPAMIAACLAAKDAKLDAEKASIRRRRMWGNYNMNKRRNQRKKRR